MHFETSKFGGWSLNRNSKNSSSEVTNIKTVLVTKLLETNFHVFITKKSISRISNCLKY